MLPACRTAGNEFTIPTIDLTPSDVAGFIDALQEFQGFCRKVRFLGQNPTIGYQKFNDLQTAKLSKKQLCDRTLYFTTQRWIVAWSIGTPRSFQQFFDMAIA
jgi:hypothetical protein